MKKQPTIPDLYSYTTNTYIDYTNNSITTYSAPSFDSTFIGVSGTNVMPYRLLTY